MKLHVQDVISYQGRDFIVQGVLSYKLAGKSYQLARAVDGNDVRFIEPLMDDLDDRLLVLAEVPNLPVGTPPPATISYKGGSYMPRLQGATTMAIAGAVPGRTAGACEVWRYRASGDVFLQIEKWSDRTVFLAGESVHKDMVQITPAAP